MSLVKFDEKRTLSPCGLINTGAICYLNSFLQSLMSCTSLTAFFLSNEERFISEGNLVAIEYVNLIKHVREAKTHGQIFNPTNIFQSIISATKKKFPNKQFGRGQEDSGEGLHLFLDAIDCPELYKLFMYRYVVKIWCLTCIKEISGTTDESCVLEIPPNYSGLEAGDDGDKKIDPLNAHVRQYMSMLDDYTCPTCKQQKCCRIYQLACVPEIITIMFNKFFTKSHLLFPDTLSFPASPTTTVDYRIVATIEHSGGQSGGHYWARCLRAAVGTDTEACKIYTLNDTSIGPGTFEPTQSSYILFYHSM